MKSFLLQVIADENPLEIAELRLDHELIADAIAEPFDHLEGLEVFTALTHLSIRGHAIESLEGIEALTKLTFLDVGHNALTDLTPVRTLCGLRELVISGNRYLRDLTPLQALLHLETLHARGLLITDWSVLKPLTCLRTLSLTPAGPRALATLVALPWLERLNLGAGRLQGTVTLPALPSLTHLTCTRASGVEVLHLPEMPHLQTISLSFLGLRQWPDLPENHTIVHADLRYNALPRSAMPLTWQRIPTVLLEGNPA